MAGGAEGAKGKREGSGSFLKKRTKKLLSIGARTFVRSFIATAPPPPRSSRREMTPGLARRRRRRTPQRPRHQTFFSARRRRLPTIPVWEDTCGCSMEATPSHNFRQNRVSIRLRFGTPVAWIGPGFLRQSYGAPAFQGAVNGLRCRPSPIDWVPGRVMLGMILLRLPSLNTC